MTRCVADKRILEDGKLILYLAVDGHANYAESGKDIVCASVSCLCVSLANALVAGGVHENCIRMKDGEFFVGATVMENQRYIEGAFDMAASGLRQIAERYPANVLFKSGVSHSKNLRDTMR